MATTLRDTVACLAGKRTGRSSARFQGTGGAVVPLAVCRPSIACSLRSLRLTAWQQATPVFWVLFKLFNYKLRITLCTALWRLAALLPQRDPRWCSCAPSIHHFTYSLATELAPPPLKMLHVIVPWPASSYNKAESNLLRTCTK